MELNQILRVYHITPPAGQCTIKDDDVVGSTVQTYKEHPQHLAGPWDST